MKKYKWMEECIIVDGYLRSCIYDLPRQQSYFIDKNTSLLINKIEALDANDVENNLTTEELEWFNFFLEKELLFKVPNSQIENFSKIPIKWENPSKILSALIENSKHLPDILKYLNELNCHHIVLIFENSDDLKNILNTHFDETFLKSVDLVINNSTHKKEFFKQVLKENPILSDIFIRNTTKDFKSNYKEERRILQVDESKENSLTLTIDTNLFMESHFHNTYYNRKIFINKEGDVFNALESSKKLGNINKIKTSTELLSLSKTKEWNATKSNTLVCQDCELRNMCVDNRIPISLEKEDIWHYETECNYNPYLALWKGEEGYLTLGECGVEVNNLGLKINNNKLNEINNMLYTEEV